MVEQSALRLKVGYGIDRDINANSISPRQILIVRQEDLSDFHINPGELRENVVIAGATAEKLVPGSKLEFDGGAAIRLTFYCEPCKRIAHLVKSLKNIERKRGILGVVVAGGWLKEGESCNIQANVFPALSEVPYERFLNLLAKVPAGKVITYKQIISGIGVAEGYYRAIPRYILKAMKDGYAAHRVLDSEGALISHVLNQRVHLEAEGVQVMRKTDLSQKSHRSHQLFVSLNDYQWSDSSIYLT